MSLTILNVAYPLAPVSADTAGGAEQVLLRIDEALVAAGHRSLVLAREDSNPAGDLLPVPRIDSVFDDRATSHARRSASQQIERALANYRIDIVHLHGLDFHTYLPPEGPTALVTLHMPPEWYPTEALHPSRARTFLHCVSGNQQSRCPSGVSLLPPIPNGVPLEALRPSETKAPFALALGRICPEKGFHLAMEAARIAGVPLVLAGEVFSYEAHQAYFRDEIEPRLNDACRFACQFIGPVGIDRKRDLLAAARCLLVPSLAPETSSLVTMEALACGTPVIAFRSGALVEIVKDGVTGYLVNSVDEMASAISRIDTIDRHGCRVWAEQNCSLDRMVESYLKRYRQLAGVATAISIPSFTTAWLTTPESLDELEPEWRALHRSTPNATPFSSPEWLIPFAKRLASGKLRVLTIRNEGVLTGLVPVMQNDRGLELLGRGPTDYLDALACDRGSAARLWNELAAAESPIELTDMRWDSCLLDTLPEQFKSRVESDCVCPVTELDRLELPNKLRKNLRGAQRKLSASYSVSIENAASSTLEEILDCLFRLHSARWATRNQTGVLKDTGVQDFHRDCAERLLSAGMLRLYGLRIDGEIRSALYCLASRSAHFYYIGGFDPALEPFSPGSMLILHAIETARAEGAHEFDFLRGVEPYKYRWCAQNRTSMKLHIA